MPRGVYPRKSRNTVAAVAVPEVVETDAEVAARLKERFEILDYLTRAALTGDARSVIISGPAGLGKSYSVEAALSDWDPDGVNHEFVKGYVRTTGLLRLLYQYREAGQVIVFDDADTVFFDDNSLNLLKAACDSTDRRVISYRAESNMRDDDSGDLVPRSFQFDGTIIFITNLDFDQLIEKGHKLAPHLEALISRSHYVDLAMKTKRDYMIRIKQVIGDGLLTNIGLTATQTAEVVAFIDDNKNSLRELSLRIALKIGKLRLMGDRWAKIAKITCCK